MQTRNKVRESKVNDDDAANLYNPIIHPIDPIDLQLTSDNQHRLTQQLHASSNINTCELSLNDQHGASTINDLHKAKYNLPQRPYSTKQAAIKCFENHQCKYLLNKSIAKICKTSNGNVQTTINNLLNSFVTLTSEHKYCFDMDNLSNFGSMNTAIPKITN